MNRMRIGFAVLLIGAVAVGAVFVRKQAISDSHRRARQIILYYTLSRIDNPIIILGDSIVEASTLPRELCGHTIVNAGLNGASTTSDLGPWLLDVLDGKPAAAIVLSLGTNDALGAARSRPQFEANYSALLAQLSKATTRVIALAIPSIDVLHRVTSGMQDGSDGSDQRLQFRSTRTRRQRRRDLRGVAGDADAAHDRRSYVSRRVPGMGSSRVAGSIVAMRFEMKPTPGRANKLPGWNCCVSSQLSLFWYFIIAILLSLPTPRSVSSRIGCHFIACCTSSTIMARMQSMYSGASADSSFSGNIATPSPIARSTAGDFCPALLTALSAAHRNTPVRGRVAAAIF